MRKYLQINLQPILTIAPILKHIARWGLVSILPVKPGNMSHEICYGLEGNWPSAGFYKIAGEINLPLCSTKQNLVRVFFQLHFIEVLVKHPDCFFELPSGQRKIVREYRPYIGNISYTEPSHLFIQFQKIKSAGHNGDTAEPPGIPFLISLYKPPTLHRSVLKTTGRK